MIKQIRTIFRLIDSPWKGWFSAAVVGSLVVAMLDMLGVAAMLPLMQLVTGADPTSSGVLRIFVEVIGTTDRAALIISVAVVVAGAFFIKTVASVAFRWWLLGHTQNIEAEAASHLMARYLRAPYWAHRERKMAEINRNLTMGIGQAFGQVAMGWVQALADVLALVAIAVVLVLVSPLATLLALVFFGLLGWGIQRVLRSHHERIGEAVARADLDAWSALMPGLHSFRESRMTGGERYFITRFSDAKYRRASAARVLSLVSELPKYVLEIGFVIAIGGIAGALFLMYSPAEALSVLGVFSAASTRLLPTLNRVIASAGSMRAGRVGLRIIANEVERLDSERGAAAPRIQEPVGFVPASVELRDVSYRYRDSTDLVLEHVSAEIEQGKTTAIVGSSGAGKSTLLDIFLGLLEPTSGDVVSGGRSIFTDLDSWFDGIGVVPQDVYILDDTLRRNIAFGVDDDDVDGELVNRVLELAQLSAAVTEFPDGLDTRMGERGVRLSGGQRQRVGIARALYRRPSILVLDEATSALDNATEERITETISKLAGSMTIVVVAHRLSTVRDADKVIFMSGGQIVAEGSFSEVEERNPEFAHLVQLGRLA